ncbi:MULTISPECIES: FAD-dependent oxidoreductase [Microbacterium]|uniref:NAD(P)/FAD-dependent oxidoreductase n=1 Tax=Microbacterium TaxID=33882 RepID=UPI000D659357|nr:MULTISPECIES: FAD-dependent oxidoreductase [Microbacterium]
MTDVVIIGGGIIGAATAYQLSLAGLRVHVLERGAPVSGTSSRGEGNILVSDKPPGPELELQKFSSRLWAEFDESDHELDIELEEKGGVLLGVAGNAMTALHGYAEAHEAAGVHAERMDAAALYEREPNLAPGYPGGLFYPGDLQVMPVVAAFEMLRIARRNGATISPYTEVRGVKVDKGVVAGVETDNGTVPARVVVNCSGAWAGPLTSSWATPLPVEPRRGYVLVTSALPHVVRHKVYSAEYMDNVSSSDAGLQASLVVEGTKSGTVLIGASRERIGFDDRPRAEIVQRLASQAIAVYPFLADVRLIRYYQGFRPYATGHLPIIGPDPELGGLFHAVGHEGVGIGLAPATGRIITEMILDLPLSVDMKAFAPSRFSEESRHDVPV